MLIKKSICNIFKKINFGVDIIINIIHPFLAVTLKSTMKKFEIFWKEINYTTHSELESIQKKDPMCKVPRLRCMLKSHFEISPVLYMYDSSVVCIYIFIIYTVVTTILCMIWMINYSKWSYFILDLSKHIVMNYGDIEELMEKGNSQRFVAFFKWYLWNEKCNPLYI